MRIERVVATDYLDLEVRTHDLAESLAPTEVLGETLYSVVSPGTEVMSIKTAPDEELPRGTGYASVDRVLEVGDDVEGIEVGDLVMNLGQHASHHVLDTSQNPVVPVPDDVEPREAPFARFAGVATPGVQTSSANPPTTACVVGLGLVGNFAGQMLSTFGYDVVGLELLESRRETAHRVGFDAVFDPAAVDAADAIDAAFPREGCGLVVECSGTAPGLEAAVDVAAHRAEILQVGFAWESTESATTVHDVQQPLFEKYLTIRSGWEWQIPRCPEQLERYSHFENYAHAMRLMARGELAIDDLITHVVDPENVQTSYDGLATDKDEYLGVVIDWT